MTTHRRHRRGWLLVPCAALLLAGVTWTAGTGKASAATPPAPVFFDIPGINGVTIHACRIGRTDQGRKPVVLEWTNYTIDDPHSYPAAGCPPQFKDLSTTLANDGYVYVAGQTRGVGASSGVADFWSSQDGRDGAAVVQWLAQQPWSNGKIGLAGCSSSSMEGLQVAVQAPPALRAIVMSCFGTDSYRDAFYPGGLRAYSAIPVASRPLIDLDPYSLQLQVQSGDPNVYPQAAMRIAGDAAAEAGILADTQDGPFWQDRSTHDRLGRVRAPFLAIGNWDDFFLRGVFEWERQRHPGDKLVMLPGWHGDSLNVPGPSGLTARAHAWFDHLLRGLPDRYSGEPSTVYWELDQGFDTITGRAGNKPTGRFHTAPSWPPPWTTYRLWRFASPDGGALLTYPSGSPGSTTDPRGLALASNFSAAQESTGNIVEFTTPPQQTSLHLAGPVTATVWITPTTPDLDLYVRLLDMAPDGSFHDVTNGWLKGSDRALDAARTLRDPATGEITRPWHPHLVRQNLTLGQPNELVVELWETAAEIPAGHSLRVFLSAQDSPWFLQDTTPGAATVLTDAAHPSRIVLPVASGALASTTNVAPIPGVPRGLPRTTAALPLALLLAVLSVAVLTVAACIGILGQVNV